MAFVVLFIWYQLLLIGSTAFFLQPFPGQVIGGLNFATVFGLKRGQLRKKFGGEADCFQDFIVWWCLPCCAAIQEAREVDDTQGVKVRCCCNLRSVDPNSDSKGLMDLESDSVGPPVAVTTTLIGNPLSGVVPEPSSASEGKEDILQAGSPSPTCSDHNFVPVRPLACDQISDGSIASSHPASLASSVPGILSKAHSDDPPRQPVPPKKSQHLWEVDSEQARVLPAITLAVPKSDQMVPQQPNSSMASVDDSEWKDEVPEDEGEHFII